MNSPPRSFPVPFWQHHGCDVDGCASDPHTWPLHHVLRRGKHCFLCSSCVILSHRSMYCCRCFFLVTSPSCNYDDGDTLMAPPAPTITCHFCCEAVVHLPCLYSEPSFVDGVFVCPPCIAAQEGRPFTYAPPCRQPLDERAARVLVLAARMALAMLQRHATAARAAAERLAREAVEARKMADAAVDVAYDLAKKEDPSWVVPLPQSPENDHLAASEEAGNQAEANVGEVRLNKMPPLATLTMGSVVPMALAENDLAASEEDTEAEKNVGELELPTLTIGTAGGSVVPMPMALGEGSSSQSKPLFDLNEKAVENDLNDNAAENQAEPVQADPNPHRALNSSTNMKDVALNNSFNMKLLAMAAAEAARASPATLQLFPSAQASSSTKMIAQESSSTKMPSTKKPRTKRPRTLQLFVKDDEKK